MSRSSFSFMGRGAGLFQLEATEQTERLDVFLARFLNDVVWKGRHRWLLVPANRFQVVAHELLVEARLRTAGGVRVARPEARGIRCQRFVDQDNLALVRSVEHPAEFELR